MLNRMFCQKLPKLAMSQFKLFPRLELDCMITLKDAEAHIIGIWKVIEHYPTRLSVDLLRKTHW